jgi:hypothetical protein
MFYLKYSYLKYNLKFDTNCNSVTSLAKLEKRLPSKQLNIGSNPIGCNKAKLKKETKNKNKNKSNDVY